MTKQTKDVAAPLVDMGACGDAVAWVRKHKSLADAWEKCERPDWMIWYLRRKSAAPKADYVRLAVVCAKRVLKNFEAKYPGDKRPREAIAAALRWLHKPSEDTRNAAYAASVAAYAAASAAASAAAYAAAYAAASAAASAAAYAAAYAAASAAEDAAEYAAAYAAEYAAEDAAEYAAEDAAASAARVKERKWQSNQIRKIFGNPFRKGTA